MPSLYAFAVTVKYEPTVEFLRLYNDLPAQQIGPGTVMIELGDLYADEARTVLLKFGVPAIAALGLAKVASLDLAYVELPGLVEHTATIPISVNVVPGDDAAGRMPHPKVRSEALFQDAQEVKRRAAEAFERGDLNEGKRLLGQTKDHLIAALDLVPEEAAGELRRELADVGRMDDMSVAMGAPYMSKMSQEDYHLKSRKRGRERPDDQTES